MAEQSFMKAMFHGVISEELVFPFPEMESHEAENVGIIVDSVRRFMHDKVDSAAIDRNGQIPDEVLGEAKALGLFGLQIPTEHEGIGLSAMAYSRVIQAVAAFDASLAVTLAAHQAIGLKALLLFGTPTQKERYFPALATGEKVAAFALVESHAGSDVAAIRTRATLSEDGSHYLLRGTKSWVTNGGIADVFTVFARTTQAEEQRKPRITAFWVERGPGLSVGPNEDKLGIRGATTTSVTFHEMRVPKENVIGQVGQGVKVAMEVLNSSRFGIAASCVGSCRALVKMAIERAEERRAFGQAIGQFGIIKDKIATMLAQSYALESMTYLTSGLVDAKTPDYSLESAICKVFGSETLWWAVNETLQIAAGIGYMRGYPYERMLRDARINLIFQGTNEILRCFIALAGMAGVSAGAPESAQRMREPIKAIGLLRDFALRKARSMLAPERVTRVHPILSREAVLLEESTLQLARHVENVLRKHGPEITQMQFIQQRVANIAIDLYALTACLSRTTAAIERSGEQGAHREIAWTRVFAGLASARLRQSIAEFEANDDELRKECAQRAYADGRYALDTL